MNPLRRLALRLGHRGMFLALLGLVQIIYGAGLLAAHNPAREHWWPASVGSLGGFPLMMWGTIWVAVGALCILSSWSAADRVGYAVGVLLNCVWAAFAVQRWLATKESGSWAPAIIYTGIAVAVFLVSGWPETPKAPIPQLPPPPDTEELARLINGRPPPGEAPDRVP